MLNTLLADTVIGVIETHPETHNQHDWGYETACGTTMCVAGHAAVLSGAKLNYFDFGNERKAYECTLPDGTITGIDRYAQEMLGLTDEQADNLFYNMNNDLDVIKNIFKDIANGGTGLVDGITDN